MEKNHMKIIQSDQFDNRNEFIDIVKKELINKFQCTIDELPINYGTQEKWSLLSLLENNKIEYYSLIYVNNMFYGGSGGMIRPGNIYQAGFRMFSQSKTIFPNLGNQYYHTENLKIQIERAKRLNCELLVVSFNEYNRRFFNFVRNKCIPEIFGNQYNFQYTDSPVPFNAVNQYLIKLNLSDISF